MFGGVKKKKRKRREGEKVDLIFYFYLLLLFVPVTPPPFLPREFPQENTDSAKRERGKKKINKNTTGN